MHVYLCVYMRVHVVVTAIALFRRGKKELPWPEQSLQRTRPALTSSAHAKQRGFMFHSTDAYHISTLRKELCSGVGRMDEGDQIFSPGGMIGGGR